MEGTQRLLCHRYPVCPDGVSAKGGGLGRVRRTQSLDHLVLREVVHAFLEVAVTPGTTAGDEQKGKSDARQGYIHSQSTIPHSFGRSRSSCIRLIEQKRA